MTDAATKKIAGWAVSVTMHTEDLPLQAFNYAVWQSNTDVSELIHHNDRGSQRGFNYQAPARSQNSVSVDPEGLLFVEVKWQLHSTTGDLRRSTTAIARRHTFAANLPGQYSQTRLNQIDPGWRASNSSPNTGHTRVSSCGKWFFR